MSEKMLNNARPVSKPCLILKSKLQYQSTSQNHGNQNRKITCTQAVRSTDVMKPYSSLGKSNTCQKQYRSQTLMYTRPGLRDASSQISQLGTNLRLHQNNTTTYSHLNNRPKHSRKLANNISSHGRCLSAPVSRTFYKIQQENTKSAPKGELTASKATRTRNRCLSAPKPSLSNGPGNALSVCNHLAKKNNTTKQHGSTRKFLNSLLSESSSPALQNKSMSCTKVNTTKRHGSTKKFSSSLLSKSSELENDSMSDAMSFSDDVIEEQLDAYSCTSDNSSIVMNVKWRPQSCISFRRTVCYAEQLVSNSKHHCVTYLKNRPRSSPNPRQRVKPKLTESHFRRGNVPKYISFVEPMPVHERPGTGKSSGYESCGISLVSEDLLVSAGTQEELADSGEESGWELDIGYRGVLPHDGLVPRKVDVDNASQEAMFSSRSSFNKSELDGSLLGGEGSNMDGQEENNLDVDRDGFDSVERAGEEDITNDDDKEREALLDETSNVDKNIDEGDFDANLLGENLGTNVDDQNESVDGRNSALGPSDRMEYDDNRDESWLPDLEQQTPGDEENTYDAIDNETPTERADSSDNNPQVTFSEPLATDRRQSTNVAEDNTTTEPVKSILKGTDSDKNKIYEHELDPSIMRRMTSPSEEADKTPSKPAMARRSADLRPQSRPDILLPNHDSRAHLRNKQLTDQETEQDSSDEEGLSDSDLYSSTGAGRRRRPKPKNNVYGKRANMKARSQKVRKKKESNENADDDLIMSAESTLLMEQILEQEKRFKEGMKPWLKGRLALSQQNSRFEIPMDVRMLETMTPMEYLTRYCIISKRRKALYQHVFQKVDRNRDGIINFQELENGLKDVHTGILDSKHVENIVEMVRIDKEGNFDLKQFSAIAAFSERISCKSQLPAELLNNFDGQKEVIECADFFALNWKLDGIKVNPDVRRILDSL